MSTHENTLESHIGRLRQIGRNLRSLGLFILLMTALNFGAFILHAVLPFSDRLMIQLSAVVAAYVLVTAILFDQKRREGEAIYGELSDELHRSRELKDDDKNRISFRIALKSFAMSMDLPFVPGRFGAAAYILSNVFLLIGWLLLQRGY